MAKHTLTKSYRLKLFRMNQYLHRLYNINFLVFLKSLLVNSKLHLSKIKNHMITNATLFETPWNMWKSGNKNQTNCENFKLKVLPPPMQ